MKYAFSIIVTFSITLLIFFGCSDKSSDLGSGLVSSQDTLRQYVSITKATSDTSFQYRVKRINSALIGVYHEPSSFRLIQSRALLQFTGFTQIPDSAYVDSAIVTFKMNYKFKNLNGSLVINVHEMQRAWDQTTFTWDSSNISNIHSNPPDTSIIKTINDSDSTLTIRIDSLVRHWVRTKTDSPNGIIFIPDTNFSDIIVGVRSVGNVDLRPVLTVAWHNPGDTVKTFVKSSIQETFVANGSIPQSPSRIYLQAGIGYRGLIRFDSLPIPKRASINKATLELFSDDNYISMNSYSHDSIFVYLLRHNSLPYDTIALATLCVPSTDGIRKVYQADIKTIVQQWVVREPNYGILLRAYGEYTAFDRFAIYGAASTDSLKPKLTITYTVLP